MTEPAATYSTRSRLLAVAVVVGLFVIPASTAILFHFNKGPQHHDQVEYHLTTILKFAAEWPSFDLKSYPAAMTPGYHLLMTLCYRLGAGVQTLQFFSLAITVGLDRRKNV